MNKWEYESQSVEETIALGSAIGRCLQQGQVIALMGDLGAGKTHLVKGIAAGAGVEDSSLVNSPTFVIINEYDACLHLYHMDAYRLSGALECEALGIDEMFESGGVVLIEWADRVEDVLPVDHLDIVLTVTGDTARKLEFTASGPQSCDFLKSVSQSSSGG